MPVIRSALLAKAVQTETLREFGPVAIPDAVTRITVEIEHDGVVMPGIAWGMFLSEDGGVTWRPYGAAGTHGPQSRTFSSMTAALPLGINRQVRVFVHLSAPALFGVNLETA